MVPLKEDHVKLASKEAIKDEGVVDEMSGKLKSSNQTVLTSGKKDTVGLKQEENSNRIQKPKRATRALTWDERYDQCKDFLKKYNHCKIPTNFKENKSLGIWVQEMRRNYKAMGTGRKPRRLLSHQEIEKLNKINFYWGFTPDPNKFPEADESWEENFGKLRAYKESHGHCDVPVDEKDQAKLRELGIWTRVQRTQKYYRDTKRKCFITKDRVKMLDGIDFNWKGEREIHP